VDASLAERVFKAYRTGLLRPPPSLGSRDQLFDFLFHQIYLLKVPLRERLLISRIWGLSSSGLRLSRDRRLDEAREAFRACWERLTESDLSPRSRLIARTFIESCNAYFEHKTGAFDLARARTYSSMEADRQLEEDEDWSILELHRIQSANNLMRIDLRSGEPHKALLLAGEILSYLEGFRDGLTVHHSWRKGLLQTRTPKPIRCALIAQVANEAVLAFSYFPGYGLEETLLASIQWESFLASTSVLHPQFRLWLLAKQALVHRQWALYLDRLLEFLSPGRADIQPIWYSAMADFLGFCRQQNSHVSMYTHDGILRDAKKWPGLPASLRPAFDLGSGEEQARPLPSFQAAGFSPSSSAAA